MKWMFIFSLFLIGALFCSDTVSAYQIVNGDVEGRWTREVSPYVANGDIFVQSSDTLIIEPGVEVRIGQGIQFIVYGLLQAVGTSEDSIMIIGNSQQAGFWQRFKFDGGRASQSILHYCSIRHTEWGLQIVNSSPVITNCRITDHSRTCLRIEGGSPEAHFCDIGASGDNGILIEGRSSAKIRNCTIHNIVDNGARITDDSSPVLDGNIFAEISEYAINMSSAASCSLSNNIIYRCDLSGVNIFQCNRVAVWRNVIYLCSGTYALYVNNSSNVSIINNTIIENQQTGLALISSATCEVVNNIIAFNATDGFFMQRSSLANNGYNDVYNNGRDNYGADAPQTQSDIGEDPLLQDPGNLNFRPSEGSPVINAGMARYRDPDGTIADIGAKFFNMNNPPVIDSHYPENLEIVDINNEVEFGVEAHDPDGQALTYTWIVNDEPIGSGPDNSYSHYFGETGDFSVTVIVSDRLYEGTTFFTWEFAVDVEYEQTPETPEMFALSEAYPNPFNESTKFNLQISQPQYVNLKVYDLTGNAVIDLGSSYMQAGVHPVSINSRNLTGGMYLLAAAGAKRKQIRKLIVIK